MKHIRSLTTYLTFENRASYNSGCRYLTKAIYLQKKKKKNLTKIEDEVHTLFLKIVLHDDCTIVFAFGNKTPKKEV
ncbi:hypothetical protein Hanom_Chr07g00584861 [Helianthus anomalus]